MLKAKLLAMCVCPALLAPPTILAVHKPARHAVAHLLHRAAERLDHTPAKPVEVAAVDCAPVVASGGPGVLPSAGELANNGIGYGPGIGGGIADASLFPAGSSGGGGFGGGFSGGGGGGGGGGGFGGGFGGGGGGSSGGGVAPVGGLPGTGPGGSPGGTTPGGTTPTGGTSNPIIPISTPPSGSPVPTNPIVPIPGGGGIASGTPEPAAWLLMITGFGAVGLAVRSQRQAYA